MKLVVANLKMNKTKEEMIQYKNTISQIEPTNNLIICPQNIYLDYMISDNYLVGAQDLYIEDNGAFTGEISPNALASLGVRFSIIGHSERRQKFNETNEFINKKVKAALNNHITPILCIGETKEERNSGKTKEVIIKQLKECLIDVAAHFIIAYEPIWAIGTGVIPTNKEIEEVTDFIKDITNKPVLYGGSVNLENIDELLKIDNVNGFLIGGASLDPDVLINIYNKCK